jgi:hypothetical protein
MGGHAKCLRLMTRGGEGGQKSPKHTYVIHGCSLRGHSTTTWTRRGGGGGSKKSTLVHPGGGGGVTGWPRGQNLAKR